MDANIIATTASVIAIISCIFIRSEKNILPTINAIIIDIHDHIKFVTPNSSNEYTLYNKNPTIQ